MDIKSSTWIYNIYFTVKGTSWWENVLFMSIVIVNIYRFMPKQKLNIMKKIPHMGDTESLDVRG